MRLLDGGRKKWLEDGRPVSTETTQPVATTYKSPGRQEALRISTDGVLKVVADKSHLLVDVRPAEWYAGGGPTVRKGHIPGAVNYSAIAEKKPDGSFRAWGVPSVRPDGTFKSAEELRALFTEIGVSPERRVVTYCQRGGLSSHAWFVLTQLLGYPNVAEYDRSWREWSGRPDTPIEAAPVTKAAQ